MPKNNRDYRKESRSDATSRMIDDLSFRRIHHHITYNSQNTPRYIIIDVEQNRRMIRDDSWSDFNN